MNLDEKYMEMALALAEKGAGAVSPNPLVGAVLVKDGEIVGKGWHKVYGGPHAEVNAIDDAGAAAEGATIYVTLEPCNHTGKTPPCTQKILENKIAKVVVAMKDPNPVASGGSDFLRANGIEVVEGVLEDKAKKINESFTKHLLTKKPFVILKCAATLDGKTATKTGDSKWITNPESRKHVHKIRNMVDAILVGIETVRKDDPSLTTRLDGECSDPVRIILDTKFSIAKDAKVITQKSEKGTIVAVGDNLKDDPEANSKKKIICADNDVKVIFVPVKNGRIDIEALMVILGKDRITSILVEGGSTVATSFLEAGQVDKVCFFYAPKILLGVDSYPMLRGESPKYMKDALNLTGVNVSTFDEDVMIEGYLK